MLSLHCSLAKPYYNAALLIILEHIPLPPKSQRVRQSKILFYIRAVAIAHCTAKIISKLT